MRKGAVQLASVLGWELWFSPGGTPVAFPSILNQEAMKLEFEVVWNDFVQIFIGSITGHSRLWDPLILNGDPVDVRVHGEFISSKGEEQDA